MAKRNNIRIPTQEESEAGRRIQEKFITELTPSLSNIELAALGTAFLYELVKRDGERAAVGWCDHWGQKLMLAAGPEAQE